MAKAKWPRTMKLYGWSVFRLRDDSIFMHDGRALYLMEYGSFPPNMTSHMNELEDDSWIHIREPRVVCRRGGTSKISQEIAEKYPMCARYFKIVCDMGWADLLMMTYG
jgi:hypothetical protein